MKPTSQKIVSAACFFLLLLSQTLWAGGQERQAQFREAAQAYSRGEYTVAIQQFEALARNGVSASLLYNLGNSYAQAGQSGKAILNYERASRLASGDSDIDGNLELVRKEKGLFQEEQSVRQRLVGLLELNQWTGLAAIAFVFFGVVLLLPVPLPLGVKQSSRYVTAAFCLLLTITAISGAVGQYRHWHDGVVVAQDARLRVSPFASAASIGTIQEGRLVRPGKSHGNYFLVEDETGRSGWLAAEAFELIVLTGE